MSKKTDKIISTVKGVQTVEAAAKKGIATFKQFETYEALTANKTKAEILKANNRMDRVDAINDTNRETPTPSAVRQLGKLAKSADAETQAIIEAATLKIIADAEARKAAVTK